MSNPTPSREAANARRQELLAEAIARAGAWLNEVDPEATTPGDTRRVITCRRQSMVKAFVVLYAGEYAALTGLHPKTCQRHITAAINGRKEEK